jgi:hypothetical protein
MQQSTNNFCSCWHFVHNQFQRDDHYLVFMRETRIKEDSHDSQIYQPLPFMVELGQSKMSFTTLMACSVSRRRISVMAMVTLMASLAICINSSAGKIAYLQTYVKVLSVIKL